MATQILAPATKIFLRSTTACRRKSNAAIAGALWLLCYHQRGSIRTWSFVRSVRALRSFSRRPPRSSNKPRLPGAARRNRLRQIEDRLAEDRLCADYCFRGVFAAALYSDKRGRMWATAGTRYPLILEVSSSDTFPRNDPVLMPPMPTIAVSACDRLRRNFCTKASEMMETSELWSIRHRTEMLSPA